LSLEQANVKQLKLPSIVKETPAVEKEKLMEAIVITNRKAAKSAKTNFAFLCTLCG
jgi:hypothetical protein